MGKKVEGNEEQRRMAAREAERAGERPSERKATTGASKQRGGSEPFGGKQREMAAWRADEREASEPPLPPPGRTFTGRDEREYGADHARVFGALGEAERRHGGEAVYATEVARTAGLPDERTRVALHDLVTVHRLVTELQGVDRPDLGPRYETRAGY
ncbi:hypothetical protein [Streptomyces sp. RFCAC02]|uniref:hypothetical protein n=1 Tax=Streptomyces sp. RFCAC02 TaxID=2499143 RepID=UPI001020B3B6|nr:hypothetical protein [Streptomyces sp. RFCAC02]